jgi:hypothetical protein
MRFLGLLTGRQHAATLSRPGLLEKVAKLMDEMTDFGQPLAGEELGLGMRGARVQLASGRFTVSSGSSAASAEATESYGVFDVESIAEAVAWTKCFLQVIGDGECELRPLGAVSDCSASNFVAPDYAPAQV